MGAPFDTDIFVPNLGALMQLHVAELDEGTIAFVEDQGVQYLLRKSLGGATDATNILAPIAGSPIAGAPGARWVRQPTASSAEGDSVLAISSAAASTDLVATGAAPVVTCSIPFTVTGSTKRLIAVATLGVVYDRGGTCRFSIRVDGARVRGVELVTTAAERVNVAIAQGQTIAAGAHTIDVEIVPTAPLQVAVNAASDSLGTHAVLVMTRIVS